jgi:hypothetical protein
MMKVLRELGESKYARESKLTTSLHIVMEILVLSIWKQEEPSDRLPVCSNSLSGKLVLYPAVSLSV